MITAITTILGGLLKALVAPLLFIWAGATRARAKDAEHGVEEAHDSAVRREELRATDDADLDDRLRRSQE